MFVFVYHSQRVFVTFSVIPFKSLANTETISFVDKTQKNKMYHRNIACDQTGQESFKVGLSKKKYIVWCAEFCSIIEK